MFTLVIQYMKIEMWNKVLFTIAFLCTFSVRAQDKCPEGIVLKPDFVADKVISNFSFSLRFKTHLSTSI